MLCNKDKQTVYDLLKEKGIDSPEWKTDDDDE